MGLNWKRIALFIGLLTIVGIVGFGMYYVLLRPAVAPLTQNIPGNTQQQQAGSGLPTAGTNGSIPIRNTNQNSNTNSASETTTDISNTPEADVIAQGGVTQATSLVNARVQSATLDSSGRALRYYNQDDGYFYSINELGNAQRLSDKKFFDVAAVSWSPTNSQVVLEYPDGANILYNFETNQQITFPEHWTEFSFSPNGQQIAFKSIGQTTDDQWLAVTNSDGSQSRIIQSLNDKDVDVNWSPSNQIIATYTQGLDFNRQNLFFVGPNDENYPLTIIEGRDFRGEWSPTGDRMLYSAYNENSEYLPKLWIVNTQGEVIGQGRRDLGLNTWADKCSFANNETIYCAVPRELPDSAGLVRKEYTDVVSDIYRIDLRSGFRSLVATPDNIQPVDNVMVSQDNRYLYYTGGNDGQVYQIKLR